MKAADLKPFKKARCHATSEKKAEKHLTMRKEIMERVDKQGDWALERIWFSDETIFYPGGGSHGGQQNARAYFPKSSKKRDLPKSHILKPKPAREQGVMMSIALNGRGLITRPHFVPTKQTVDLKYYAGNMRENDLFVQIADAVARDPPEVGGAKCKQTWFPQEDGASSHTAAATRKRFKELKVPTLGGLRDCALCWPPSSPDLSPNDYFLRGEIKRAYAKLSPHPKNIQELRPALIRIAGQMPKLAIVKACASFRKGKTAKVYWRQRRHI